MFPHDHHAEPPRQQPHPLGPGPGQHPVPLVHHGKNAQESIDEIAEALELAQSPEEEHSILWWWNEGCRDYATDMVHLDELNAALPARRAELFPKG